MKAILLAMIGLVSPTPVFAAAAPQLFGKSIAVSFNIYTPAIGSDGTKSSGRHVTQVYYVSNQGRAFARGNHVNSYDRETKESGPESGNVQISGSTLNATGKLVSGAVQIQVRFEPSFQSCTARVVVGEEGGKGITYVGFKGVTYTATGKTVVSNVSCSISDGNALSR